MTIEEMHSRLDALLKTFPASGFDTVHDNAIAELKACAVEAGSLGMKSGQQLITILAAALKNRKTGGIADENIQVQLTAFGFYIKNFRAELPKS
jgi:hypothetical protein